MHKNGKTIYLSVILLLIFSVFSFAGNYPFPQEANYPYGIRATNANTSTIQSKYNTWKATYVQNSSVCSGCMKVVSPEPVPGYGGGYTVSEGIAYGMLASVYMDDQATFDGLAKFKINRGTAAGKAGTLLPWIIDGSGNIIDKGSATDADIDIAFAFLMADKQWGGSGTIGRTYISQAQTEIANIKSYDVVLSDNHLKPGDAWDDHTFPSYFITAFLREFQTVDGDARWATIANKCFTMINSSANSTTGLIGEIITTGGAAINYEKNGVDGRKYDYNSCRVPWRTAMDYAWYGTAAADTYTTKLASFFAGKGPTGIRDGYYYQNGTSYGANNNAAFVGPAGCAFMATTDQTNLNNFYSRTSSFSATESYYNGALQVLTLLFMSGNMPNFRIMDPEPSKTPTPVPDGQVIDYFDDYLPDFNTANDWGGYWYTWADAKTLGATVFPAEGEHLTMTAGGADAESDFYLHITGSKAAAVAPNYPSVGIGTELKEEIKTLPAGQDVVDLTDFWITKTTAGDGGGIRFWCKGDGVTPWKIMLGPKGSGSTVYIDWASHEYEFIPPTTWTQISIPFGQFTQPAWTSNLYDLETEILPVMQEIKWQVGTNSAVAAIDFSLDKVELFPYLWEPTPVPTATFTFTPTITATFGASELLDDCEDADGVNNWGGDWFTYDDSPNAGTSFVVPEPGGIWAMDNAGAASTAYSARMTGTVTDVYANGFVGMGTNMMSTGGARNCTPFLGIRFWAKGDGLPYTIKLVPIATINTGSNDWKFNFTPPSDGSWKQYQIAFTEFTQEQYWGTVVPLTTIKTNLMAIHFQTVGQPWSSVDLSVDQIQMYPSQNYTPTRTKTPTSSNTSTHTQTYTFSNTPTDTATHTATNTPTETNTATNTSTNTSTHTNTNTATDTPTQTATNTGTNTHTHTYTATDTVTNTPTDTATSTNTATNTFTNTNTATATFTNTPTDTNTSTNTHTATNTPTETNTPVTGVDLVINSASITSETVPVCIVGTGIYPLGVRINYANQGDQPAGAFTIDIDGNEIPVTGIPASSGGSVWIQYVPSASVSITIDSAGTITELNETNNTFTGVLPMATEVPQCTNTPTDTFTNTPTSTDTNTATETDTATDTPTATFTDTQTQESTATETDTIEETYTYTSTHTNTHTNTHTATNTNTIENTPTHTATVDGGGCLMEDGEDGDNTNLFGGYWYTYGSGNGTSIVPVPEPQGGSEFEMTAGGYNGSLYAASFSGTVGTEAPDYPSIGMGAQLNPMAGAAPDGDGTVTDISSCTGVRFYAKGDGKSYHVKIPYSDADDVSLTGYNDYKYNFTAPTTWTLIDAPFTLFGQASGWGTEYPLATVLANAKAFQFQTSEYATAGTVTAELWIDDLIIYGCTTCPTPPVINTPTYTNTPTETYTNTNTSTQTHTFTETETIDPASTDTHTHTITETPTQTFTNTYSNTSTNTATNTSTYTNTQTPTPTLGVSAVTLLPATGTIAMPAVATIAVSFNLTGQNATSTRIELVNASSTPVYTFVTDTTLRAPGSQTINVSTAGLTGMADGNYTIKVTVMNSTLGQMREASSAVRAFDMAAPSTFTPTNTNTFTATNTHTYTNTPTHTSTFTYTPTPTATSKVLEVTDLLPYPNPYDPIAQPFLRIKVKVTQKDVESLSVRIYSSAQRLIDEKVFEGQALTQILSGDCVYYQSETLKKLSNGTYYYVIMVTKDGKEVRSKVDKVIILKSKSK